MSPDSESLCTTCASSGRRLSSLDTRTAPVLKLLAPEMGRREASVCWECEAVLLRVHRFRLSVQRVQIALHDYYTNKKRPESTSRLKATSAAANDYVDGAVKIERTQTPDAQSEVKIEPDTDVDFAPIEDHEPSTDESDSLEIIKAKVKLKRTVVTGKIVREKGGFGATKKAGKRVRKVPDVYVCKECGKEFKTRGTFEYHKESHRDKPQCEDCGRTFVSKSTLWTHRQLVHVDGERWTCAVCKKVFFTEAGHAAHAAAHSRHDRFYCRPCGKFFKSNSSFRKHRRSAVKHLDPAACRFGCSACDRKFQTEERAREHYDIIHLQKNKFACRQCTRLYCTARALRIHVRVKHENVTQPRDKVCELCGKGFRTSQVLKSHIRTHTGERPYSCRLCPSKFTQNGALHTHTKLVHLNVKRGRKKADQAT